MADGTLLVGSPTPAEIERAITRPAARAGLVLEDGLAETMVDEAGNEPGLLPLLSVALTQVWEQRTDERLTYAGYVAVGGIAGAIGTLAEAVWSELEADEQSVARVLLLRLAGPGDGVGVVRRRVPLVEIEALSLPGLRRVLERLAKARLLTIGDAHVEVAHEALFREWPRLRAWLADDAAGGRSSVGSQWLHRSGPVRARAGRLVAWHQVAGRSGGRRLPARRGHPCRAGLPRRGPGGRRGRGPCRPRARGSHRPAEPPTPRAARGRRRAPGRGTRSRAARDARARRRTGVGHPGEGLGVVRRRPTARGQRPQRGPAGPRPAPGGRGDAARTKPGDLRRAADPADPEPRHRDPLPDPERFMRIRASPTGPRSTCPTTPTDSTHSTRSPESSCGPRRAPGAMPNGAPRPSTPVVAGLRCR